MMICSKYSTPETRTFTGKELNAFVMRMREAYDAGEITVESLEISIIAVSEAIDLLSDM